VQQLGLNMNEPSTQRFTWAHLLEPEDRPHWRTISNK